MREAVHHAISNLPAAAAAAAAGANGTATEAAPAAAAPAAPAAAAGKAAARPRPRPPVRSAREAALELMNVPHPLDILADAGAYGNDGAISRYHNPDNCEAALFPGLGFGIHGGGGLHAVLLTCMATAACVRHSAV